MATLTRLVCDIKGCEETASYNNLRLSACFTTEQNEGRQSMHYLQEVKIDLCFQHYNSILSKLPVVAAGAMGNNTYTLR